MALGTSSDPHCGVDVRLGQRPEEGLIRDELGSVPYRPSVTELVSSPQPVRPVARLRLFLNHGGRGDKKP